MDQVFARGSGRPLSRRIEGVAPIYNGGESVMTTTPQRERQRAEGGCWCEKVNFMPLRPRPAVVEEEARGCHVRSDVRRRSSKQAAPQSTSGRRRRRKIGHVTCVPHFVCACVPKTPRGEPVKMPRLCATSIYHTARRPRPSHKVRGDATARDGVNCV